MQTDALIAVMVGLCILAVAAVYVVHRVWP